MSDPTPSDPMPWQAFSGERLPRRSIDGRFAFGMAVLLSGIGLLALMDRIGVPEGFIRASALLFSLTGLGVVAALLRTMRISTFYAAARGVPAPYAGLAIAGLGATLFLPYLPPEPQGTTLSALFAGFACGIMLIGLVTGPILRKTGALSLPDLITARFPKLSARLATIFFTAIIGFLVTLAGYQQSVSALMAASGLEASAATAIVGAMLLVIVLPGGLASTLWFSIGAAAVATMAFGLPFAAALMQGKDLAVPLLSDTKLFFAGLDHLKTWTSTESLGGNLDPYLITAIAIGLGVLGPLLGPSIACRNRRAAQSAGIGALVWGLFFVGLSLAVLAAASQTLSEDLIGQPPEHLKASLYEASGRGGIMICGAQAGDGLAALSACVAQPGFDGTLKPQDIRTTSLFLLQSFPGFGGYGAAFNGIVGAGLLVLCLGLAAAGLQTTANTLGNDMFHRVRDRMALTSRRLAVTRGFAIALVMASGLAIEAGALSPRGLIAAAILISAATLAPVLMLSLWRQATSVDAIVTLLTGVIAAELMLSSNPFASSVDGFAASALFACGAGLLAGMTTSLFRRHSDEDGDRFLEAILSESDEWLHPDRGV